MEELAAFEGSLCPAEAAEAIDHHALPVHERRVAQLTRLEVPLSLAQADATASTGPGAQLVHRGCPPRLGLPIVR